MSHTNALARRAATALGALSLIACASTSPDVAFRDTQRLVQERTGRRIVWNQGGADDAAVARSLRALLERELTVDAAVQVALLNNRRLQAVYEELSVAQADLVQAGLLQNPVFGAGLLLPVAGQAQTGGTLSIAEDFLGVFTLAARRRVASAELAATRLHVGDAVLQMTYEVQAAFYALQCARQVAAMRQSVLEAADAATLLARQQSEAGNLSDLDLANQQTLYEQLRTDQVRSASEVIRAHEALARLLGVWGGEGDFRVSDKLPELPVQETPLEHLEALAASRRLDLAEEHERVHAVAEALALAKDFRWLGTTSLGAAFEKSPEGFSVAGPTASLELPIFDQKQATIARLEAHLRATRAREQALAIDVRAEVRTAQGRLLAARSVVERYAKVIVPLRQRVVELSQQQYDAMLLGAAPLLLAKQNEINAYREFIEALAEYWTARAELERATGGALALPITTPSAPTPPPTSPPAQEHRHDHP